MLIGAALLLLVIVALLAIPVTLSFRLSWPQPAPTPLTLQWAFGLVRVELPAASSSSSPASARQSRASRGQRRNRRPASGERRGTQLLRALRQRAFRRRLLRFVGDCWRALRKSDVQLRLRIGLGDPADTGQLWAMMGPLAGVLASRHEVSIAIIPEFDEQTVELSGSGSIQFVPLQLLYLAVGMGLSTAWWLRREGAAPRA